jgi:hypothetical protein
MRINVDVISWFTRFTGGKSRLELDLPPGTNAGAAVLVTGIPEDEIGFITVNGQKAEKEQLLAEGDSLKVYPLIIGG